MNKEILVIDDNPDIRFLICNILEEQNFKVRSAANYDQAVLEINKRLPDLAIIDIKLDKPDKDGIDLLKLVIKKNKLTPIIMISGHATVKVAVEAIRLGAYEFIEKPFSKEKIIELLTDRKVEKNVVLDFEGLLKSCEFARYTPTSDVAIQKDYNKAVKVISSIDKQFQ